MPGTVPLLKTKLFIPPAPPERVLRPQLLEQLDDGLHRSLILISAPAGFGKTTLLSQWVRQRQLQAAWISLDKSDNDLSRLLTYLVSALDTINSSQVNISIEDIQSIQPTNIEPILTRLINRLAGITSPFVLILDDYQFIEDDTIHEVVNFLLEYHPPNFHLVIASRVDPPLPIARLRGRGKLLEIRSNDLRFNALETKEFLNNISEFNLSDEDVHALAQHTEGWVAGLQMAAVSMQGRENATSFVQAFTGSHRFILDYLMEEVLQRQTQDVQEFLLKTSILERLTAPLCETVTGQENSQSILEDMERCNLFLTPMDDERRWYRYHHLFADLLRSQLEQTYPKQIKTLHNLASKWYRAQAERTADHNIESTAIAHALSAEAYDDAVEMIKQIGETILLRGELAILKGWLKSLPANIFRRHPELYVYEAIQMLIAGQSIDEIEKRLQYAESAAQSKNFQAKLAAIRGLIAVLQGRFNEGREFIQIARSGLATENQFWRNVADRGLAMEQFMCGDVEGSLKMLDELISSSNNLENLYYLAQMADLYAIQGRLDETWEFYQRALEAATERSGSLLPVAGVAQIGMSEVLREWNKLEEAEETALKGIELVHQWGELGALDGYINLIKIRQSRRDFDGAHTALKDAVRLARRFDATDMDDFLVANYQARLQVAAGEFEAAWKCVCDNQLRRFLNEDVISRGRDAASVFFYLYDMEQVTLARVHIARGDAKEALAILDPLSNNTRQSAWTRSLIEHLVLQSMARAQLGDEQSAHNTLQEALQLAEPLGMVRIFLDEGEAILDLLKSHVWQPESIKNYVNRLLKAAQHRPMLAPENPTASDPGNKPLPEPLSERELEVLQLVASGLTNREIAERLVIAPSTVKTHINNIYGKLNASRRTQAVARARELGLVA